MIPIVFPFTYRSQSNLDVCLEWFEKIVVYQPSDLDLPDHYKHNHRLIIRTPMTSHLNMQKFKQEILYLRALESESDPNLDHLKARPEDPPFYQASSAYRIRDEIKEKTQQTDQADTKQLLIALYCQLFQNFDKQQTDLNQTWAEIENSQKRLFQQLNNEPPSHQLNHIGKTQITHIQERLKIWFYMYQYDEKKSNMMVTDNQEIMKELQEWNDDLNLIFRINESQMANAKQMLQDKIDIQLHQISQAPMKTKTISLYHKKNPLTGPFIPENLTRVDRIWMIVLE